MPNIIDTLVSEGLIDTKSFRSQIVTTTTSASTLSLSLSSELVQAFIGSVAGQLVKLPDATTLQNGHRFEIWNLSSNTLTAQHNDTSALVTIGINQVFIGILRDNTTSNGVWMYQLAGKQTGGVTPPFIFSFAGGANIGTYLRSGSVPTSDTGQVLKGTNRIVEIHVSSKAVVASNSTIQFQRRSAVSTRSDISGAFVTLPTGQYKGSSGPLNIIIGPDWEMACYTSLGSFSSPVVVLYLEPV